MPSAMTRAQAWTLISKLVIWFQDQDANGHANSPNFLSRYGDIVTANIGIFPGAVQAAADNARAVLSSGLDPKVVRAAISAALNEMMKAINAPEAGKSPSIQRMFYRLWRDMQAQGSALQSQGYVRGAVTITSAVGNGAIARLYVDCYGRPLEGSFVETKTIECTADQQTVERHSEILNFRGAALEPSLLQVIGSGIGTSPNSYMKCFTTRDSEGFLSNPTFSAFSGATQPSAGSPAALATVNDLSGWVVDSITGASVTVDRAYRDLPTETNKYSVQFSASNGIQQNLSTQRRPVFKETQPIFYRVAIYKGSSCDGTLTITLGASTYSIAMSALTNNNGWNLVYLPADRRCWLTNFTSDQLLVRIAVASQTTGTWNADDILLTTWNALDGCWWGPEGGSVPFQKGDLLSVVDAISATRGVLSYWLNFRADIVRRYSLPCAPKAPSGTIAVALAGGGAGNVDNGAHTYSYTFVDVFGNESSESATAAVTVSDHTTNGKVSVSSVAAGPASSTAARNIYRSKQGTTTPRYLLHQLADNSTTIYTDNTADASLPATVPPSGVTIADPT